MLCFNKITNRFSDRKTKDGRAKRLYAGLLAALLLLPLTAIAQVTVSSRIDDLEMLVGQQTNITLTVTARDSAKVEMPVYKELEMMVPGVEVLETSDMQTTSKEGGMAEFMRTYRLTSFDDTLYLLPPMMVMVDGQEHSTNELALKIVAMEVDTTQLDKFFGPKDVQDNPFLWSEWEPLFWLSLLMLVLLVVGVYLFLCLRDNKPVIKTIKIIKKILPHQKAMKAIEEIKADKMVSSENQKEYYTRLTDTLRQYIEERYGFSAMEMTSSEIISRLSAASDAEALNELRTLFTTADLVKFAKHSALINENDMNLVTAIDFINSTKVENLPTEEKIMPEMTKEEEKRHERRTWLFVAVCAVGAVCLTLFAFVVYRTVMLLN